MRGNEYLRFGIEAESLPAAKDRARELWKVFGLPDNVRVFNVKKLVPKNRYEVSLAPNLDGL